MPLAAGQLESLQTSLQPNGLDENEHKIQATNLYWSPWAAMTLVTPPSALCTALIDLSRQSSTFMLTGGVRILESPETLADTLRRRPHNHFWQPHRPYGSFLTGSPSGFNSTIMIPAWWGSSTIAATRGFRKTTNEQIDVRAGEVLTEAERSAAVDVTEEVTAQPIPSKPS